VFTVKGEVVYQIQAYLTIYINFWRVVF